MVNRVEGLNQTLQTYPLHPINVWCGHDLWWTCCKYKNDAK